MQTPLTIGLVTTPDKRIRAWEKKMLEPILASPQRYTLFVFPQAVKKKEVALGWIHSLFNRLEKTWFRALPDAWTRESIPASIPAGSDEINYHLLYVCADADPGAVDAAGLLYGCWYIGFGTGRYAGAQPAFYHEVMQGEYQIGLRLMIRRENEPVARAAYEGSTALVPFSVRHSSQYAGWKAATLLPDRLHTLRELGGRPFFDQHTVSVLEPEKALPVPGTFQLLRDVLRNLQRYLTHKWKPVRGEFSLWLAEKVFEGKAPGFRDFQPLRNPPGCFRADPFLVEAAGVHYLFFEEYSHAKGKAHIALMTAAPGQSFLEGGVVLDRPYHLSYPGVFPYAGEWYMLPETVSQHRVELYRATRFPDQWEPVAILLENTPLGDPTLFFHQDTWWLMGTRPAHPAGSDHDQLLLYFSDDLFGGRWEAHPQNPVVTTVSSARPAGAVMEFNGELYRPAQNNAGPVYGYGSAWQRITRLSRTEYREETVWTLDPGPADPLLATHHLSFGNGRMVIDGMAR